MTNRLRKGCDIRTGDLIEGMKLFPLAPRAQQLRQSLAYKQASQYLESRGIRSIQRGNNFIYTPAIGTVLCAKPSK